MTPAPSGTLANKLTHPFQRLEIKAVTAETIGKCPPLVIGRGDFVISKVEQEFGAGRDYLVTVEMFIFGMKMTFEAIRRVDLIDRIELMGLDPRFTVSFFFDPDVRTLEALLERRNDAKAKLEALEKEVIVASQVIADKVTKR